MNRLARALVLVVLCATPLLAGAQDLAPQAPLPASKDLYSFADLYRLTAGGAELPPAWGAAEPAADVQFRVRTVAGSASGAAQAAAYVFSISRVAQPESGLLLLAGLVAALWVARRRLGFPIRR